MNNLNYIRTHQQDLRADCYSVIRDRVETDDNLDLDSVGKSVTILPSSFAGSPRNIKERVQDCMAIVRRYHRPDFFVTFTCNPKWKDIVENISEGANATDYPDIVCRVFRLYLKELMKNLTKDHVLGRHVAHAYTVEFQKRGLPHAHILLIVENRDAVDNPEKIDKVVSAFLPDRTEDPKLHDLVKTHMMHQKCNASGTSTKCHNKDGKCSKHFPKDCRDETLLNPGGGYPVYARPEIPPREDGLDNRWVVPYNAWLLKKFRAHINVEVCSSVKAIRYIYKYIHKGNTGADMEMTIQPEDVNETGNAGQHDEISSYLKARWLGSTEACWRLLGFPMSEMFPPVERLDYALPDEQRITFNPREYNAAVLMDRDKLRNTKLNQWFRRNAEYKAAVDAGEDPPFQLLSGENPLDVLYSDIPEHYTWIPKEKTWRPRKKGFAVGRMYFSGPKAGPVFYLRTLLLHVAGATSYEDLCTVNGRTFRTSTDLLDYQGACAARGFLEGDAEWHETLDEATVMGSPPMVRSVFVAILMEGRVLDPKGLWESHQVGYVVFVIVSCRPYVSIPDIFLICRLAGDSRYRLDTEYSHMNTSFSGDSQAEDFRGYMEEQLALYEVQRLLSNNSINGLTPTLQNFSLPSLNEDFDAYHTEPNAHIRAETSYVIDTAAVDEAFSKFNDGQHRAAAALLNALDEPEDRQKTFFLCGPGGGGKTFVINNVLRRVRSRGDVAIAVAASGIAATLLDGGATAHSRFKIPLDATAQSTSSIKIQTAEAEVMQRTKLIIWDEAPMQSRFDVHVLNKLLQDVCNSRVPFAGKVVCFCGDFRQTLPVVVGGTAGDIINRSICSAEFWPSVTMLELTENMRLANPNLTTQGKNELRDFATDLLRVGDGTDTRHDPLLKADVCNWRYGWLDRNERADLIDAIYRDLPNVEPIRQAAYIAERTILAPVNADVIKINEEVLELNKEPLKVFRAVDMVKDDEHRGMFQDGYFAEAAKHQYSLPPYILELKVGMPVMVLRNLDPPLICNGTRLIVDEIGQKNIKCRILTGSHADKPVLIPKIWLSSKDNDDKLPCTFMRKQFPLRPAYAMTVNKSQGQSIKYVGLELRARSCFAHGQLYVAVSRVTQKENLYLIARDIPHVLVNELLHNTVYKQVFRILRRGEG